MELRVLGCHGGETPRHRTTAFLLDETLALDAGCLTSRLELDEQARLKAVVVSHAHLDHIRDLATVADNRCQLEAGTLIVAATAATIAQIRAHFFNDKLWPDFTIIPAGNGPTIQFLEIPIEQPTAVLGYKVTAVPVSHTVDTAGFVIDDGHAALGFSGDTGPTDRLWEVMNHQANLKAMLMEVSFPNREQKLAELSGHHTPRTLLADLEKYRSPQDLPTLLYHIKPPFQAEVEKECAALRGLNLQVLSLKDHFVL